MRTTTGSQSSELLLLDNDSDQRVAKGKLTMSKDADRDSVASHCSTARTKRTMYGVVWECVKPGLWKSECGWYSATRRWVGGWEGRDLETGRSIFGESLMSVVYQFKRGSR